MAKEDFPGRIKEFVSRNIDSVEQLEVLLILRNSPEHWFSVEQLSDRLRSSETSVEARLIALEAAGLIVRGTEEADRRYRYHPVRPEFDALVGEVAEAYITRRFSVINLIYTGAQEDSLRGFADAFRLRRN